MGKDGKKERKPKSGSKEKKVKVSVLYEITIKGIDKLARDDNGNKMFIQYKRGKKSANQGKTKEAVIQYNFVQWDEKINMKSTLLQTPSTGKFDSKTIDFHVIRLSAPKFKSKDEVAVLKMNMSDYAQPSPSSSSAADSSAGPKAWNVIQSVQFPVTSSKSKADAGLESVPQFEIMVKSRWLKYNGKLLVQSNKEKESGRAKVRVGDEDFDLQTDREGSDDDDGDTTLGGGGSDDESEVESEFEDDDDSDKSETSSYDRKSSNAGSQLNKPSTELKTSSGDKPTSRGGGGGSDNKTDAKRVKALQEEIQKLKQQLRQVNETSQIRLENISAQKREIEDLREQIDGGKPASSLAQATDSQVNDLIKTIGLYFKKDKDDSERTCYWLGFTASLTTLFTGMAMGDEAGVPSSLQSRMPDLRGVGIDLEKQAPSAEVLRSVSPPARTAFVLEMLLREIYLGLLNSFYRDLDEVLLPVIFDDQTKDLEKMEMLSKKKGSASRQPFTWKLSAVATQMAANRLPLLIQLQFFTQIYYYVGAQLWNALVERPDELCTAHFGFHLKYAVSELRSFINAQSLHDENYHPSQQLNRVLDAAGVLVVSKGFFDDAKIPQDLYQTFPSLSLHEIKFLLETFVPDKSEGEKAIPTSVKRKLDAAAQKEGSPASLELDPFARVPSPFASSSTSNSSSSSSSSSKNSKPKGRR